MLRISNQILRPSKRNRRLQFAKAEIVPQLDPTRPSANLSLQGYFANLARLYDPNNKVASAHLSLIARECVKRGKKMYNSNNLSGAQKEFERVQRCDPINRVAKYYLQQIGKKMRRRV